MKHSKRIKLKIARCQVRSFYYLLSLGRAEILPLNWDRHKLYKIELLSLYKRLLSKFVDIQNISELKVGVNIKEAVAILAYCRDAEVQKILDDMSLVSYLLMKIEPVIESL